MDLKHLNLWKQSKANLRAHDGKLDIHKMLTIENLIKPGAEQKVIRWHLKKVKPKKTYNLVLHKINYAKFLGANTMI